MPGCSVMKREDWQEEEEEEGYDRNGHLRRGRSPPCTRIDSCQLCSHTAGRTAAARRTHPHLTGEKDAQTSVNIHADAPERAVQVDVCVRARTCLAPVSRPAKRTGTLVGSQTGTSVQTGLPAHSCDTQRVETSLSCMKGYRLCFQSLCPPGCLTDLFVGWCRPLVCEIQR